MANQQPQLSMVGLQKLCNPSPQNAAIIYLPAIHSSLKMKRGTVDLPSVKKVTVNYFFLLSGFAIAASLGAANVDVDESTCWTAINSIKTLE
ncbi:hypothetical protein CDAR_454491 [Caerostris darwini]|uniref:Uncharacterized protein n=1 Tax=Caerostris darwini TaxID=1538125 RepID=A0AAV4TZQ1_9ARAC|nr:hypothetical protein CDAR_454491 [Caerostris darwini]